MHKTEPATSKGTLQAHGLQALKILLDQNSVQAGSLLGCGGRSFVAIDI